MVFRLNRFIILHPTKLQTTVLCDSLQLESGITDGSKHI